MRKAFRLFLGALVIGSALAAATPASAMPACNVDPWDVWWYEADMCGGTTYSVTCVDCDLDTNRCFTVHYSAGASCHFHNGQCWLYSPCEYTG